VHRAQGCAGERGRFAGYRLHEAANATVRLTEAHTYEHLVADANIAPSLPERMTRWLDGRPDGRSPDIVALDLHPGDRLLLCSDGLSSYVPPEFIDAALTAAKGPAETADRLVELAIRRGGPDNISVIVIDVPGSGESRGATSSQSMTRLPVPA
jgi:protein phosphatase